jgi:hypothetical protein
VILKRFLAPDLVFSLGIFLRTAVRPLEVVDKPPWHAFGQAT